MILKSLSMVYLVNILVNFGYSLIKGSPSYRQYNSLKKKIDEGNNELIIRLSILYIQKHSIHYDIASIIDPICNLTIYFEILSDITGYIVEKLNKKGW